MPSIVMSPAATRRAQAWATGANRAAWASAAAGGLGWALLPSGSGQFGLARLVGMALFAIFLLVALVAATLVPQRRRSASVMLGAVVAWGVGLGGWYADLPREKLHTPNWFEYAFVASYLLMGVFLLRDVPRPKRARTLVLVDTGILAAGAVTAVGMTFVHPTVLTGTPDLLERCIAMAYPIFDASLAAIAGMQVISRQRPWNGAAAALMFGFTLMAVADAPPAAAWALGQPDHRLLVNATWGVGLALIVWACTSAHQRTDTAPVRLSAARRVPWSVGIGTFAVLVLALRPATSSAALLTVAAVATLLLSLARALIAVREARDAEEAHWLSFTDDLTHLPNRRAIHQHLEERIAEGADVAVLLLDLDGFKRTNDGLGHAAGDELLRLTADRLRAAAPHGARVARLSGDEFAVVVRGSDEQILRMAAQDLVDAVSQPVQVAGVELSVGASVGVARSQQDDSGDGLLRRADVAMYEAKARGGGVAVYDEATDPYSAQRLEIAEQLRVAIREGDIEAWFQPQVDSLTGELVGLETLARWRCADNGEIVNAAQFLPIARRAGLMPDLQRAIATAAVRAARSWHAAGLTVRVSLNVDAAELLGVGFLPFLVDLVAEADLPAYAFTIEVTEDVFLSNPVRAEQRLRLLDAHHIGVSIDSFGSGFSSVTYLRDLPIGELKIDTSFVKNILTDERARLIMSSTATLAHALAMRLVAEGVESAEVGEQLRLLGVDVLQGYQLSAAMEADAVEQWARERADMADRATRLPR